MALCVSCKACRRECPTGVDMAKMKIEVTAARADRHGVGAAGLAGRRAAAVCAVRRRSRRGQSAQRRSAAALVVASAARLGRATRRCRRWRRRLFPRRGGGRRRGARGEVILLATRSTAISSRRTCARRCGCWRAAGYRAITAVTAGRPLCCGRTCLASGHDRQGARGGHGARWGAGGRRAGDRAGAILPAHSARRVPLAAAGRGGGCAGPPGLAAGGVFGAREARLALRRLAATAHVHGHCHQKVIRRVSGCACHAATRARSDGQPIAVIVLRDGGQLRLPGGDPGRSRAMAEAGLLPAVRAAATEDVIVADGTSAGTRSAICPGARRYIQRACWSGRWPSIWLSPRKSVSLVTERNETSLRRHRDTEANIKPVPLKVRGSVRGVLCLWERSERSSASGEGRARKPSFVPSRHPHPSLRADLSKRKR